MKIKIMGFENLYEIDEYGTVYGIGKGQGRKPRILKNCVSNDGYYYVGLCKNAERHAFRIHRLLASHFIYNENPDVNTVVNHKDNKPLNNDLSNLEWVTQEENAQGKNCLMNIDNTSGYTNISYHKLRKLWGYQITEYGVKHQKWFKTIEKAIEYKINYEK
jgi:hypothetical protein